MNGKEALVHGIRQKTPEDMRLVPVARSTTQSLNVGLKFLIGGLVIPLISNLGINNKVQFLEKFGTGPPNSTGKFFSITLLFVLY